MHKLIFASAPVKRNSLYQDFNTSEILFGFFKNNLGKVFTLDY